MKATQLIEQLQALVAKHGPEVQVMQWSDSASGGPFLQPLSGVERDYVRWESAGVFLPQRGKGFVVLVIN